MSYLLDTHALLWWLFDDRRLSRRARGIIRDRENRLFVSSASAWEIATKHRIGKLASAAPVISDFGGFMTKAGFSELPVRWTHAVRAGAWDVVHRDPFDRMLAAHAAIDDLTLVTADQVFDDFGIQTLW